MYIVRIVLLLVCFISAPVFADQVTDMHKQSAFLFAKRKDWNNAILHAKAAHSEVLVKYFTWLYLKDPESEASFDAITAFLDENPDWPDKAVLEKRAEVALMADNPSDAVLNDWFSKHAPKTNAAKAKTLKDPEVLNNMIREAWISDNYDKNTEQRVLAKYHSILRARDHIKRIDRLLWEGEVDDAKRLLKYVPKDDQLLFQARIALAEDKVFATTAVMRVSKVLKSDPGLLYERIRWRARSNDRDGVRELLLVTPAQVPYPEKWWPLRDRQIRIAIGEGNIKLADRLLARHGQKPDTVQYKEAMWLKGWIELQFHNNPQKAYDIFTDVLEQSETPAGKAKAAYWAGRAAEKIDKSNPARWFGEASSYTTTYYGQLAAWELNKKDKIKRSPIIAENNLPTAEEKAEFEKNELVQLVYELVANDENEAATRFISYLAQSAESDADAILATDLGRKINRIDLSVRAAKKILQRNIVTLENGWPIIPVPSSAKVEKPLLLGLMRQESEFYADAVSTSGACGLMQLLPGTAKEMARKEGYSYTNTKLFDPDYNMTIGSIYLNKLIKKFEGSYVLAIASYNAGPARVAQWVSDYGRPTNDPREIVDWIEKIPTGETRNYVQHVMENVGVYRFLLAGKTSGKTVIADDLVR